MAKRTFGDAFGLDNRSCDHSCCNGVHAGDVALTSCLQLESTTGLRTVTAHENKTQPNAVGCVSVTTTYNDIDCDFDVEKDDAAETHGTCSGLDRDSEVTVVDVLRRRIVLVPYADSPQSNDEPDLADWASPSSDDGIDSIDNKLCSAENGGIDVVCAAGVERITYSVEKSAMVPALDEDRTVAIIESTDEECAGTATVTRALEDVDFKTIIPIYRESPAESVQCTLPYTIDQQAVLLDDNVVTTNDQLSANCEQSITQTSIHVGFVNTTNSPTVSTNWSCTLGVDCQLETAPLVVLNNVSNINTVAEQLEFKDSAATDFMALSTATESVLEYPRAAVQSVDCVLDKDKPVVELPNPAVVIVAAVQQEEHRDSTSSLFSSDCESIGKSTEPKERENFTSSVTEAGNIAVGSTDSAGEGDVTFCDFFLNECSGEFERVTLPDVAVALKRNCEFPLAKERNESIEQSRSQVNAAENNFLSAVISERIVDICSAADTYSTVSKTENLETVCAKEMSTFGKSNSQPEANVADATAVTILFIDSDKVSEQQQCLFDTVAGTEENILSTDLMTESNKGALAPSALNEPIAKDSRDDTENTCMKSALSVPKLQLAVFQDTVTNNANNDVWTATEREVSRPLTVEGFDETQRETCSSAVTPIVVTDTNTAGEQCVQPDHVLAVLSDCDVRRLEADKADEEYKSSSPLPAEVHVCDDKPDSNVLLCNEADISNALQEHVLSNSLAADDCSVGDKRKLEDDEEEHEFTQIKKRVKKSVNFDGVTVYYFPRAQGFCCVPSQGGSTLGMAESHSSVERFSVGSFARMRKLYHRHKMWQRERDKQRILQQLGGLSPTKLSPTDLDVDDLDSSIELDDVYFLQPLNTRERRRLLKIAGVDKIDMKEMLECNGIRSSREVCGCSCRVVCDPKTCQCSIAGIECQVDRLSFPCGCTREGCGNPNGRVEFNPLRVRMHLLHTLMRLELQQKREGALLVNGRGAMDDECVQRQMLMDEMPTDESSGGEEEEDGALSEGELGADDNNDEDLQFTGKFNSNERGSCKYCQRRNSDSLFANAQFYGNNGHVVRHATAYSVPEDYRLTRNGQKVTVCSSQNLTNLTPYSYVNDDVFAASDDSADECYSSTNREPPRRFEACAYTQTHKESASVCRGAVSSVNAFVTDCKSAIYGRVSHAESISGMLSPLRFMQNSYQNGGSNGFATASIAQQQLALVSRTNSTSTNSLHRVSNGYTPVSHETTTVYGSFAHIYGDHAGYVVRDDHADYIAKYSEIDIGYHSYAPTYSVYNDVPQLSSASTSTVNAGTYNDVLRSFQDVNASMQNSGSPYWMSAANTMPVVTTAGGKCISQHSCIEKNHFQHPVHSKATMLPPGRIIDTKIANRNPAYSNLHIAQESKMNTLSSQQHFDAAAKVTTAVSMSLVCPLSNDVVNTMNLFNASLPSVSICDTIIKLAGDTSHGLTLTTMKQPVEQRMPSDEEFCDRSDMICNGSGISTADVCPAFEQVKVDSCLESVSA